MEIIARGTTGTIVVDDDWITIRRTGVRARLNYLGAGERRIPLASITAVEFKRANPLTAGYMRFLIPGASEGLAGNDENSFQFKPSQQAAFDEARRFIESKIAERNRQPHQSQPSPVDIPEQLGKLAALRDQGVLTEEEFQAQKARLLS